MSTRPGRSITLKITIPATLDTALIEAAILYNCSESAIVREFIKLGLLAVQGDSDHAKALYTKEGGKEVRITFQKKPPAE